jgi:serine/threonine-protein kinase RsbW
MTRRTATVPARLDAFARVGSFLEEIGAAAGLGPEDRLRLRLVVEELFTNTVAHGHGGDSDAPVTVSAEVDPGRVALVYEDTAPGFDPLAPALQRDGAPAGDEDQVGGRGIFLITGFTEEASYTRADDRNRISLIFRASTK